MSGLSPKRDCASKRVKSTEKLASKKKESARVDDEESLHHKIISQENTKLHSDVFGSRGPVIQKAC